MRCALVGFKFTHVLKPHNAGAWDSPAAAFSTSALEWLATFTNHEKAGVPAAAGTDTAAGFDLRPMRSLLQTLDSPQQAWPAVHVAGTKGKGSVVAMVASILEHSGYRVGRYTR